MAAVLVDTNVLIDVATEDEKWFEWSSTQLGNAAAAGKLTMNAIVYAEFSICFDCIEAVETALSGLSLERLAIPHEAALSVSSEPSPPEAVVSIQQRARAPT